MSILASIFLIRYYQDSQFNLTWLALKLLEFQLTQIYMQKKKDKSIDYVHEKAIFSIHYSEEKIIISIEDRNNNKETELVIDNIALQRYAMTVAALVAQIKKQSLYQGQNKQHLLTFDGSAITIAFNYPKCQTKPITFKCNWKPTQKSTIQAERMLLKAHRTLENIDDMFRLVLEKMATYVDSKLSQTLKALTEHYQHLIRQLNDQMYQKGLEFDMMLNQCKTEQQERFNLLLKRAIERILDSNNRYFDQFRLMKTNFSTDIMQCDQNIKEISNQVSDLRGFMMTEQEKMEDQIIKANVDLKDLQDNMRYKFKQIKAILLKNEVLQLDLRQVDLKKQPFFETIGIKPTYSAINTNPEVLNNGDQSQVKEDSQTQLPILDRKSLSQLHLNQNVFEQTFV